MRHRNLAAVTKSWIGGNSANRHRRYHPTDGKERAVRGEETLGQFARLRVDRWRSPGLLSEITEIVYLAPQWLAIGTTGASPAIQHRSHQMSLLRIRWGRASMSQVGACRSPDTACLHRPCQRLAIDLSTSNDLQRVFARFNATGAGKVPCCPYPARCSDCPLSDTRAINLICDIVSAANPELMVGFHTNSSILPLLADPGVLIS